MGRPCCVKWRFTEVQFRSSHWTILAGLRVLYLVSCILRPILPIYKLPTP
jgi:hypothetical protein